MQKPHNPILKQLGFSINDRVVIIHCDDIGMCQATIDAYADLDANGAISSGSIMMPCSWSLAAVEYGVQNPQSDLGIHLTFNSEWKTYRWGPLSTRDPASGLLDPQGYFYTKFEEAQEHPQPKAVELEIKSQIQFALDAGLHPTHVDTHMLTLIHPTLLRTYLKTAYDFGLPAMIPRWNAEEWQIKGYDQETAALLAEIVAEFEEQGYPMLDYFTGLKLHDHTNRIEQAQKALASLPAGLSHFYLHPSKDTPEARNISPDWRGRVADYEVFMDERMRVFIRSQGIHLVQYRTLLENFPKIT